jgi:hypothetical protein
MGTALRSAPPGGSDCKPPTPAPAMKSRTSWFSGGGEDSPAPELGPAPPVVAGVPLCAALADAEPELCGVPAAAEPVP